MQTLTYVIMLTLTLCLTCDIIIYVQILLLNYMVLQYAPNCHN